MITEIININNIERQFPNCLPKFNIYVLRWDHVKTVHTSFYLTFVKLINRNSSTSIISVGVHILKNTDINFFSVLLGVSSAVSITMRKPSSRIIFIAQAGFLVFLLVSRTR